LSQSNFLLDHKIDLDKGESPMKRIKSCCARLMMLKLTTITAQRLMVTTSYLRAIKATQNVFSSNTI